LTNQWRHVLHERLPPEELKEYRLQESIRVRRHQHRQERTMSQEEFLEHRAKMAASKREQRRKRQKDDETPDEEAARKSYKRDRKREQRRRKNESQTDCIALQNKLPPAIIGGRALPEAKMKRLYCYVNSRKHHLQFLQNGLCAARSFKIVVHAISMPITFVSRD
jgi:hypothetical protein